jgi:hypothetical protein
MPALDGSMLKPRHERIHNEMEKDHVNKNILHDTKLQRRHEETTRLGAS